MSQNKTSFKLLHKLVELSVESFRGQRADTSGRHAPAVNQIVKIRLH